MSDTGAEARRHLGGLPLVAQIAGFAVVGAFRTLISYFIYVGLLLATPYWVAFSISYVAILLASLVVNGRYVFNANLTLARGVRYSFVYCGNYLLSLGILTLAIKLVGLPAVFAPFVVIPIMFPVNFLTERYVLTR
jgi:putative flippase GtrA